MKLTLLAFLSALTAISTQAQQGAVTFGNNANTPIRHRFTRTNITATVALYGSTATNLASDSSLTQIGATANTFTPGLFSGGTRTIGLPGDLVTLQVRAWTGGFATFELAFVAAQTDINVLFGSTPIWVQPVGGGTLPTLPITGQGRFQGLRIPDVPEPSSIALAFLAVAAFIFRLRRS